MAMASFRLTLLIIVAGAVVILWLPLLSEIICFFRRSAATGDHASTSTFKPKLLFLVPAHNEELLIGACVRSLVAMDYPRDRKRVIVIGDNCSDATGKLSLEAGAEYLDRIRPDQPGKPQAIAWALDQVELRDFDACMIVDADSTVSPDFANGIAELAPLNDIVVQGNFGILNEYDNWLTRLGGLLSRCRYEVTYPLKQSAGLNCPITGNGMGFGTNLLLRDGWQSFSITEDSELYAVYTTAGVPIRHANRADLFSQEASSLSQGTTQRRRWMAGRIQVIRAWAGRILRSKHISWHQKMDAFVELGLSSPVLHLAIAIGVATVSILTLGSAGLWLAALAGASLAGLLLTTAVAVWRHPQPWRTIAAFIFLPLYAGWRLLVLIGTLATLRDTAWRKTKRTAH